MLSQSLYHKKVLRCPRNLRLGKRAAIIVCGTEGCTEKAQFRSLVRKLSNRRLFLEVPTFEQVLFVTSPNENRFFSSFTQSFMNDSIKL